MLCYADWYVSLSGTEYSVVRQPRHVRYTNDTTMKVRIDTEPHPDMGQSQAVI